MEKRSFSVAPSIIYHLIVAQAGSLGKAALECVMNSTDAGATRIDIEITRKSITIVDDGQGFRSRKEIEAYFEVFGFDHKDEERTYGKFGIGRGQLWSFCSTIWRTGTFKMDVDIKNKGLDYDLVEDLVAAKGVSIEGTFYTPLKTSEVVAFEKELEELAKYLQIPLYLNKRLVNANPADQKWDHDIEQAWIRITDGSTLAVYNLGVLVRQYPSYHFGCGGVVVTKPGVRLELNMARNDILVAQCQVWKEIRKFLQAKSDERVRTKRTRLTEHELENFARRISAGEVPLDAVENLKILTDICGRSYTIREVGRLIGGYHKIPLTVAPDGSRLGEQAHRSKMAFVLATKTLERFGVESVQALRELLETFSAEGRAFWDDARTEESLEAAVPSLKEGYEVIPQRSLTKHDRAALSALRAMSNSVSYAMQCSRSLDWSGAGREVFIGVSDTAQAWTDGKTMITFERRTCDLMKRGIGGFAALANIMVHEYLHDSADVGSHQHDEYFYERYHEMTCGEAGILSQAVYGAMRAWLAALNANHIRVPAEYRKHLELVETLETSALQAA